MSLSALFIRRPVATTLLTLGIALAGGLGYFHLPVAPLPQVDFPTISVTGQLPGASPDVMASSVATPLERHLGTIADVTEMTSSSTSGSTRITLQFGLDRDIDGAARDVQAAINAARADLPTNLPNNPTYKKVNPADAPILILALTSHTLSRGQIYDAAVTVMQQKLSQIGGIGQVDVGGSSLPAVRVELNPNALFRYGIGLEDVRAALAAVNAHSPKGVVEEDDRHLQIYTNDQVREASAYRPLVVAYRDGAPVRLSDVADVDDSVENLRNSGLSGGKPAVLVLLYRQPGANIIDAVDRVMAALPQLQASVSKDIDISVAADRSTTIRQSLHDVEITLLTSVLLVILIVFAFLQNFRAALVPSVAVPISLIGTFGVMYLLGYSLDNLSLMALTIATGFVVDDAIVVLENVSRHIEAGMGRFQAALQGAREVGFTVLSMSLSLVAVFIPIIFLGSIVGRLFREFAITLTVAVLVSLVVSLTTTPMMCAYVLKGRQGGRPGRVARAIEGLFGWSLQSYDRALRWVLAHPPLIILVMLGAMAMSVYLYVVVPKGFLPEEDTGRLIGTIQADQSISFQLMRRKLADFVSIIQQDPAVDDVTGYTGGGQTNSGLVFVSLKPKSERGLSAGQVIGRLRRELAQIPGATLLLQPVQDFHVGGRQSNALYQFTLQSDNLASLYEWTPKLVAALQKAPALRDVSSDQQRNGLETDLTIDRDTAARLGIATADIDNTLYDAFGQREVSTIFNALNQYHVIMEVEPQYWANPEALRNIYVSTAGEVVGGSAVTNTIVGATAAAATGTGAPATTAGAASAARNQLMNGLGSTGRSVASSGQAVSTSLETMVPLSTVTRYAPGSTPLAVTHQGLSVASTISFNLAPGRSLSDAAAAVTTAENQIGMPASIHGGFQGTAKVFQQSLAAEPYLIFAAIAAVYIVLGILYENYIHPITILSTLPSAGLGAVLALMVCHLEFSIIALIGVILLIGIVKKNAIMMIDFAIHAERDRGMTAREAIHAACLVRFRPIMMTTMAALLGALPLALGIGEGAELRQPLGIAVIGGLIVSQLLTLFTTPVVYLYLDRLGLWSRRWRHGRQRGAAAG
ncbi:MAG: efflux RND transporter permease subunit, partial [Hypericibacter sp.]